MRPLRLIVLTSVAGGKLRRLEAACAIGAEYGKASLLGFHNSAKGADKTLDTELAMEQLFHRNASMLISISMGVVRYMDESHPASGYARPAQRLRLCMTVLGTGPRTVRSITDHDVIVGAVRLNGYYFENATRSNVEVLLDAEIEVDEEARDKIARSLIVTCKFSV